jgi:hypothetical protein
MNGITINDKQYIFIATSDDFIIHCDKCDLTKDGYSLSCNALCATFHELTRGHGGYGVFKELKEEK